MGRLRSQTESSKWADSNRSNSSRNSKPSNSCKQGDFDARSDGIFLSVVATAVAIARIGEAEIEIGRVGIVAGVNRLNSRLAESDFPRLISPRGRYGQRRQSQSRRTQHPSKDLVPMISSPSSL